MSIKKKELKSKPVVKVTFRLPKGVATAAKEVALVGDFNEWNKDAAPMKPLKSGDFTTTVELDKGNEYQFRYLIDGETWTNDDSADKYVASPFGADNSVVVL
ncbi:MAG: isoamylase early set domain-containing protein [Bacteroidota bacterium]